MALEGGMIRGACAIAVTALVAFASSASGQSPPVYPTIRVLGPQDLVFQQLVESIEDFHHDHQGLAALSIYSFSAPKDLDLFSLAAATSISYDTLATLNRLPDPGSMPRGRTVLIPSQPGIFVAQSPENDLEYLVKSLRSGGEGVPVSAIVAGRRADFLFFPGESFLPNERTFFLVAGFRFPLPKGIITSGFGSRVDPFTGSSIGFHSGIDIAAPYGTQVYASRSGKVETTGYSDVYGNYVVIVHDSAWETLYGHLSAILVTKGQGVKTGDQIGLVGSTGMSTGPHLHFETRHRGLATDPVPMLTGR